MYKLATNQMEPPKEDATELVKNSVLYKEFLAERESRAGKPARRRRGA